MLSVILFVKCQACFTRIVIWQPRELWFESDLCLSWAVWWDPSGPCELTQEAEECLCGSPLAIRCTSVAICSDQKSCVYTFAFPSQWTHLACPTDHPIGRFWLSKITFFWGLIIRYRLPVQITALCWEDPQTAREIARPVDARVASMVTEGRPEKSHSCNGFLEVERQLNIPLCRASQTLKGQGWAPENISCLIFPYAPMLHFPFALKVNRCVWHDCVLISRFLGFQLAACILPKVQYRWAIYFTL